MGNILYAGFHCVEITPPLGQMIPGYYYARYADGIADPLRLRAAALVCGDEKAVIFNCESQGIRAAAFDMIKKRVAEACDISEDAIIINCVHAHTTFRITAAEVGQGEISEQDIFLLRLYQQFADCARLAFENLKPCTMLCATGEAKGIAFVRRYRMADGTARTNPPARDPNIVGPIDTPDERVRVIRLQREGEKEILMVSFGTHADTIGGTKYTPDWPGYLVNVLNGALEGQVHTMFLLGAEGNCGTRNAMNPDPTPKGVERAKKFARRVAGAILRVYDTAEPMQCDVLRCAHKYVQIGKNDYDPAQLPMVEEIVKIYREKGDKAPELSAFPMKHQEALRIKANLSRPEFFNLRISGIRIGDLAVIGIPGEPFSTIGMEIIEKSDFPMTLVLACTNGHEGYYPDAKAYTEPGYSYERASSPFAADCGPVLIKGALAVLNELK